jgi:hypothetical protein
MAAIAFCGAPKLVGHIGLGHLGLVSAVCWTPWILFTLRKSIININANFHRSYYYAALAGGLLAVIFIADPRWLIPASLLAFCFILASFSHTDFTLRDHGRSLLIIIVLMAVLFLTISAVVSIPLTEFTLHSTRNALDPLVPGSYELPAAKLFGFILPDFGGWAEWMTYSGILVIFLAILAPFHPKSWTVFWWGAAVLGVLVALGSQTPIYEILLRLLPGARLLRVPPRLLFMTSFALAVLSGYGLEALVKPPAGKRRKVFNLVIASFWLFVLLLSAGVGYIAFETSGDGTSGEALPFLIPFLISLVSLGLLIAIYSQERRPDWFGYALIGLVVVDLVLINTSLLESRELNPERVERANEIKAINLGVGGRFYSPSYGITQLEAAEAGLELADGVNPLQLTSYWEFMSKTVGFPIDVYSVSIPPYPEGQPELPGTFDLDLKRLGWLGVSTIVSSYPIKNEELILQTVEEDLYVYMNPRSRPLAWIQEFPDRIYGDWRPVNDISLSRNSLELNVQGPGTLVMSEVSYPGWQVFVDDQPAQLEKIENLFRAISLPSGNHQVRLVYRPTTVYAGVMITIFGIVCLYLLWRRI